MKFRAISFKGHRSHVFCLLVFNKHYLFITNIFEQPPCSKHWWYGDGDKILVLVIDPGPRAGLLCNVPTNTAPWAIKPWVFCMLLFVSYRFIMGHDTCHWLSDPVACLSCMRMERVGLPLEGSGTEGWHRAKLHQAPWLCFLLAILRPSSCGNVAWLQC